MRDFIFSFILGVLIIGFLYGVSWLITCGIIKLITLCFGLTFSWSKATGIWIIECVIYASVRALINNKK